MVRVAVVEDDKNAAKTIKRYIERYAKESHQKIGVKCYQDGDEIVENYKLEYDIIFMDIQMKFMDGITAAKRIREHDQDVIIIFITNMAKYAIRGYEVNALDYVLKPIYYFSFSEKLGRAIGSMDRKDKKYITIGIERGLRKLDIAAIKYIESQGHKLIFHLKTEDCMTQGTTMKALEEQLVKYHFYRCNKGYLVNLEYVEGIKDNCAIIGDNKLPISRIRKNDFFETLINYVGE